MFDQKFLHGGPEHHRGGGDHGPVGHQVRMDLQHIQHLEAVLRIRICIFFYWIRFYINHDIIR